MRSLYKWIGYVTDYANYARRRPLLAFKVLVKSIVDRIQSQYFLTSNIAN